MEQPATKCQSPRFLLDSGLHVSDVSEAPGARDVDDVAPLVPAEGRWAWAELRKPGCRASSKRLWSGSSYVMPLALVSGIKEAESQLVKQLRHRGPLPVPWAYLRSVYSESTSIFGPGRARNLNGRGSKRRSMASSSGRELPSWLVALH